VLAKAKAVKVILVSDDSETVAVLCNCMEQMAMQVEVCADIESSAGKLCRGKFEAVVIDFSYGAKALELVIKTHEMTSHKKAVVIAVLNDSSEMPGAFRAGASFTLVKPLLAEILAHTLRAAYPMMVREMRRYYRCAIEVPVRVATGNRTDFLAETINISEGGMAIVTMTQVRVGEQLTLIVVLPGMSNEVQITANVCWTKDPGHVGLEFVKVPAMESAGLQSWLSDRLEESLAR
jgi:ActR/RegA family two-component response regulator